MTRFIYVCNTFRIMYLIMDYKQQIFQVEIDAKIILHFLQYLRKKSLLTKEIMSQCY